MYIGRGIDSIDNISTLDNLSFNGSDATFNLTQNSVAFVPVSADALQIQIDGVIQSGNYTVSGSQVTFDFTPSGSSVCNGIKHFGVGVLTTPSDGSVNMAQLGASGTKDATTFLRGDNTFATVSGTTINTNADNRVITGSGTANTLNGESNLTYDGTRLGVGGSDLGIGLQVKTGDSGVTVPDTGADDVIIENNNHAGISICTPNNKIGRVFFADPDDSDVGYINYDHSTNLLEVGVNAATRMFIRDNGDVDIGAGIDASSGFALQVDNNKANCGQFVGDMDDGGSAPFTFSRLAHDGTIFIFKSPSGDTGSISVSGGTVSYNTFTGSHYCEPPSDAVPNYGELISFTGTNKYLNDVYPPTDKWRQAEADQGKCSQSDVGNVRPLSFYGGAKTGEIIYGVEKTTTANDRKVLGGYFLTQPDKPDLAAAVGNYDIWVVDKGANIAVGDWLISSDVAGHAMRDDGTTYSTAYVFAMSTENVDWSTVTETVSGTNTKKKKISVLFERFVRN